MKNLFFVMLFMPFALSAQTTTTFTRFEGENITGVEASSAFNVRLVKSADTKAVVEIDREVEPYTRISRGSDGVVKIHTENMDGRIWRKLNSKKDRIMRLTLYLPEINVVRLSGATELTASDAFTNKGNLDIHTSGASEINGLNVSAPAVKMQCSGASEVSMAVRTDNLIVLASGASEIDLRAQNVITSKLSISGASEVAIDGDCQRGEFTVSGASELECDGFVTGELSISASGASGAVVNVSEILSVKASGGAKVRYTGGAELRSNVSGGASLIPM